MCNIKVDSSKGSGKITAVNDIVALTVESELRKNGTYDKKTNYSVTLVPRTKRASRRAPMKTGRSLVSKPVSAVPKMIQVAGGFPVDMNPDGCDDLRLDSLVPLRRRTVAVYSEPAIQNMIRCGVKGMMRDPDHPEAQAAQEYLHDIMGGMAAFMPPHMTESYLIQACEQGEFRPSFEHFREGRDEFLGGPLPEDPSDRRFVIQLREVADRITSEAWDSGEYQIPILLDHLHYNAFAHNGLQDKDDIARLIGLLGEEDQLLNARVIHSLLHVYDSLYMNSRDTSSWRTGRDLVRAQMRELIPDDRERRCFFRLLNLNAGNFLEHRIDMRPGPDGLMAQVIYSTPYAIADEAMPGKNRQYGHARSRPNLRRGFRRQLRGYNAETDTRAEGSKPVETGTTENLPNEQAENDEH